MKNIKHEPLSKDWNGMQKPHRALFEKALGYSIEKVRENMKDYTNKFLSAAGKDNNYYPTENIGWTTGFWTGMVWIAYAVTKDEEFLKVGKLHSQSFKERVENDIDMNNHDIGFMYSPSCVADYMLTGDDVARDTAVKAAQRLAKLYRPVPGIIQRGGDMENLSDRFTGVFIVDCLMNIPFWYWTAEETGDKSFKDMAYKHLKNSIQAMVQENAAVVQHGKADVLTGELTCDSSHSQGKGGDDACWSRGQAWAMYGLALSYDYTRDNELLDVDKCITNYFLNRLTEDFIANWDLYYTGNDDQRDTSAASIAVCGILELASHLPLYDDDRHTYECAALKILESLTVNYLTCEKDNSNALLKGGVYAYRIQNGINEPCVWGDYFYMEALWRVSRYFKRFW